MTPCPGISRGTDCTVPIVPGLVRVIVVPGKSSTVSLFVRALRMRSSYAATNRRSRCLSACLMFGTTQRAAAVGLRDVDGEAEVDVVLRCTAGLPSTSV